MSESIAIENIQELLSNIPRLKEEIQLIKDCIVLYSKVVADHENLLCLPFDTPYITLNEYILELGFSNSFLRIKECDFSPTNAAYCSSEMGKGEETYIMLCDESACTEKVLYTTHPSSSLTATHELSRYEFSTEASLEHAVFDSMLRFESPITVYTNLVYAAVRDVLEHSNLFAVITSDVGSLFSTDNLPEMQLVQGEIEKISRQVKAENVTFTRACKNREKLYPLIDKISHLYHNEDEETELETIRTESYLGHKLHTHFKVKDNLLTLNISVDDTEVLKYVLEERPSLTTNGSTNKLICIDGGENFSVHSERSMSRNVFDFSYTHDDKTFSTKKYNLEHFDEEHYSTLEDVPDMDQVLRVQNEFSKRLFMKRGYILDLCFYEVPADIGQNAFREICMRLRDSLTI